MVLMYKRHYKPISYNMNRSCVGEKLGAGGEGV